MSDPFIAFETKWLARLQADAEVAFVHGPVSGEAAIHTVIADAFVEQAGFKPIGFNWELLDANAAPDKPRSALAEITKALAEDIAHPGSEWLGQDIASECAHDFLAALDPASRTVVSNRYDGLWNPISGASVEWGFVGYDERHAALLLIVNR